MTTVTKAQLGRDGANGEVEAVPEDEDDAIVYEVRGTFPD